MLNKLMLCLGIVVITSSGCFFEGQATHKDVLNNETNPGKQDHDGKGGNQEDVPGKNGGQKSKKGSVDVIDALVKKQQDHFSKILNELTTHGKKTSHWIWWVFPSEKPGTSEPGQKTNVELKTAGKLLSKADLDEWVKILSKIDELLSKAINGPLEAAGNKPDEDIIPSIDYSRIRFSLKFWLITAAQETAKYPEFKAALEALARFDWRKPQITK